MVGIELQGWNKKTDKKSPQSSFLWKQLYSSFGLKAARTACNALQEKINFNIISMPIYVYIKWVSFYSFCLNVLGASSSNGSFAIPTSKVNLDAGQQVLPW